MNQRLQATDRQVVIALLNAIATHPAIINSEIYEPAIKGSRTAPKKINIKAYRTFGGIELIEPGLTLAVYHLPSRYANIKGVITTTPQDKSLVFKSYTLGNTHEQGYLDSGVFRLVVQLYYLEPSFNAPLEITSTSFNDLDLYYTIPHGNLIQLDTLELEKPIKAPSEPINIEGKIATENKITVTILPAEEILRDWLTLLRHVVRDLNCLKPFNVRQPTIVAVDYPSGNWIRNSENLVFHTAYLIVEYEIYEPRGLPHLVFPKPQSNIGIEIIE